MQKFMPIILICSIPFLISLAHDVYLYTENQENGFLFSSLGYAWTQYDVESFKVFMRPLSEEARQKVNSFLGIKATPTLFSLIILLPLITGAEYFLLKLLFGRIGGTNYSSKGRARTNHTGRKSAAMNYKKK